MFHVEHRQEYRMKIERLLKKYAKLCKKASAIHKEILNRYEEAYLINDTIVCKQIINSLYGRCVTTIYEDTDSIKSNRTTKQKTPYDIIYKDFNKKSEV